MLNNAIDNIYFASPLSIWPSNENNHISFRRKEPSTNQAQL